MTFGRGPVAVGPRTGEQGSGDSGAMTTTTRPQPVPSAADPLDPAALDPNVQPPGPGATTALPPRPFGAQLRMSWWKPLLIITVPLLVMFGGSLVFVVIAVLLDQLVFGASAGAFEITPAMMLATNLSLVVMAPVAIALTAWLAKVPWRSLLSAGDGLRWRRLAGYLGVFSALVLAVSAVGSLLLPESMGLGAGFAITGTSVAFLLIAVLTTPLQAAAEELAFRGAMMPAIGSWVRAPRLALALGLVGSSLLFGLAHFSIDPWLLSYYTIVGVCTAAMAIISRGLEAPIAFHVGNNLVLMVLGALFSGGGNMAIDRSVGAGGPFMLVFIAMDIAAVLLVVWHERRSRRALHA